MKFWQTKAFGKLAGISVRTLHHYDQIGLLKPSGRQNNNYRLYSEKDLLKLQQIIAMKFFGFELSQIQYLLSKEEDVLENLRMQSKFLREKAETLLQASDLLKQIDFDCRNNQSLHWEKIIQLIEVYKMTQKLEDSWVNEIFTAEELKEYATFEAEIETDITPEQKANFEKGWFKLVDEVRNNITIQPHSEKGIALGKKWMDWVNNLYGKKYAHLRTKKFEKGFGEGKGLEQHGLTPEIISWIDKAMDAYWDQRIVDILAQVGKLPSSRILECWNDAMDEMYGNESERKAMIPAIALENDKISAAGKAWLKSTFDL